MKTNTNNLSTNRRGFIGSLATSAAAIGLGGLVSPIQAMAEGKKPVNNSGDNPEDWLNKITGKHRIVFDAIEPNGVFPFAWPRVFLMTNAMTGTPEKENSVVVVLRHEAIPFAMNSQLWSMYNLGEVFKVTDTKTNTSAVRNAFYKPDVGDFMIPGVGAVAIGINELQESGVIFCVCNMAMTVYSAAIAKKMNADKEKIYNDFKAGIIPGVNIVPSGVWAIGRAQERGCAYCRA